MQELADANADIAPGGGPDVESAWAKINLALHVISRRTDGYHEIESLVAFADLTDIVRAMPSYDGPLTFTVDGAFGDVLASDPSAENLVLRAGQALSGVAKSRQLPPTELRLTKNIPIAAGLGGGSADAAAALRLLNRYWKRGFQGARLAEIGVRLGADVPMCLSSRPAIAKGIGERLTFVSGLPRLSMVLVCPEVALSTAEVYGRLEPEERSPLPPLPSRFESVSALASWLGQTRNDLVRPATSLTGLVEAATNALSSNPDCLFARMSGSGAAVFGIFATSVSAERAAKRISGERPDWWVKSVETFGS